MPALVGFVVDSDAVVVEGHGTGRGYWRACLAREVIAGYCEDDDVHFDAEYPTAERAVELAVAWAADAGLTPDPPRLLGLFQSDGADMCAERLFFGLVGVDLV